MASWCVLAKRNSTPQRRTVVYPCRLYWIPRDSGRLWERPPLSSSTSYPLLIPITYLDARCSLPTHTCNHFITSILLSANFLAALRRTFAHELVRICHAPGYLLPKFLSPARPRRPTLLVQSATTALDRTGVLHVPPQLEISNDFLGQNDCQ